MLPRINVLERNNVLKLQEVYACRKEATSPDVVDLNITELPKK